MSALDALDRHSFDKTETHNPIDTLYSKVFPFPPVKDNPESDAPTVLLLCQWAVGPQRNGEHRAIAVAKLLEHRQAEATSNSHDSETQQNGEGGSQHEISNLSDDVTMNGPDSEGPPTANGDANGTGSNTGSNSANDDDADTYAGLPIYHNLLFKFLDTDAPTLGNYLCKFCGCRFIASYFFGFGDITLAVFVCR